MYSLLFGRVGRERRLLPVKKSWKGGLLKISPQFTSKSYLDPLHAIDHDVKSLFDSSTSDARSRSIVDLESLTMINFIYLVSLCFCSFLLMQNRFNVDVIDSDQFLVYEEWWRLK